MKLSKMTIDELELLSYTSIAKLYLEESKTTLNTANLFKEICNLLKLSENEYQDKIVDFFQSLTTSKDFILLDDGTWDLKSNHKVKYVDYDLDDDKADEDLEYDLEPEDEITEDDEFNSIDDEEEYAEEDLSDLTILNEEELEEE